jgi:hypothetical protein
MEAGLGQFLRVLSFLSLAANIFIAAIAGPSESTKYIFAIAVSLLALTLFGVLAFFG